MIDNNDTLAGDLLDGAAAIAAFLGMTERRIYHLHRRGSLPLFSLPGSDRLLARKSELDEAMRATRVGS